MSAWLEARRLGITGSDIAQAVAWKSTFDVVARKAGHIPPKDLSGVPHVEWGNILEPVVLEQFSIRTGRALVHPSKWADLLTACDVLALDHEGEVKYLLRNREHPWMLCTPDTLFVHEDGRLGHVSAKTGTAYAANEWEDGASLYSRVQLQWEMLVSGLTVGSIPCLLGGSKWSVWDRERDQASCDYLFRRGLAMWNHVLAGTMPEPEGGEYDSQAVREFAGRDKGETITLDASFEFVDDELEKVKAKEAAANTLRRSLEDRIRIAIGTASVGRIDGTSIYWSNRADKNETRRLHRSVR